MDILSVRVTALLPVFCLLLHCGVVFGKFFWRKKHGLTRKLWSDLLMVGGFWFCLSVGVLIYFSRAFYRYTIQLNPPRITLEYFPFKTVKIPIEDLDMLQIVKPEESGRIVRRGWKIEVHDSSGNIWRSLNVAPRKLKKWTSDRIYRKDLMSFVNLFESQ